MFWPLLGHYVIVLPPQLKPRLHFTTSALNARRIQQVLGPVTRGRVATGTRMLIVRKENPNSAEHTATLAIFVAFGSGRVE